MTTYVYTGKLTTPRWAMDKTDLYTLFWRYDLDVLSFVEDAGLLRKSFAFKIKGTSKNIHKFRAVMEHAIEDYNN